MEEIVAAGSIALLSCFALHDIVQFVRSFGRGAFWALMLGVCLPCVAAAYLIPWVGLPNQDRQAQAYRLSLGPDWRCAGPGSDSCLREP